MLDGGLAKWADEGYDVVTDKDELPSEVLCSMSSLSTCYFYLWSYGCVIIKQMCNTSPCWVIIDVNKNIFL